LVYQFIVNFLVSNSQLAKKGEKILSGPDLSRPNRPIGGAALLEVPFK